MSNGSGNNNRSRVLFGFGAVVAVLIAAILLWPSNVRKEDASGAIGAVQKHHAPQIAQQDVVLGGEQLKAQQKVAYTDFREDAGKLRALANGENAAARQAYARELNMRMARMGSDSLDLAQRMNNAKIAADVQEINAMAARGEAFDRQLAEVTDALSSKAQFARLGAAEQALGQVSLADEQAASRALLAVETELANVDRARELGADLGYLEMMQVESRALARSNADELNLAARRLDARATVNEQALAADESLMASHLSAIDSALGMRFNEASMVNNKNLGTAAEQLASQVRAREAAARSFSRQIDARQSQ